MYENQERITESEVVDGLRALLYGDSLEDTLLDGSRTVTYADGGYLTYDEGFVIHTPTVRFSKSPSSRSAEAQQPNRRGTDRRKEITMPESTFILRFTHYDSSEIEEQEHTTAAAAWDAFRLFAEPDSFEIYSRVELVEYNWTERQEYPLAQLTFLA